MLRFVPPSPALGSVPEPEPGLQEASTWLPRERVQAGRHAHDDALGLL